MWGQNPISATVFVKHGLLMKTHDAIRSLLLLSAALLVLVATGCGTVRGAGRDISHVGYHVQHAGH
jgi:predicted small secreted protein